MREKNLSDPIVVPYELYQLESVDDTGVPEFIERLFLFPKEKLDFVQQDIKSTFHFRYFANYLYYDNEGLNVKTIVVEKEYTCLTFLEDYVNYYAKCYTKYGKKCRRIHLFGDSFNEKTFQKMLYDGNDCQQSSLQKSYLGCIVIKPLPKGIIGVTYLRTYRGDEERHRHYTAIHSQTINLFGTSLCVNTMPFMEQDSNVGACASTALWMAFQKTSELFHTQRPSPSEITLLAGSDSENTGKIFPSSGLVIAQICKAINNNGLHSELRHNEKEITSRSWLQGFSYAYLKAEIPILLGIEIEGIGSHLITLNGFRFKFDKKSITQEGFCDKSQNIAKFYAHDDQTGPFSVLKFNNRNDEYFLRTSWWKNEIDWRQSRQEIADNFKKEDNYYNCKPTSLIVPLDKKIKVSYEEVAHKINIIGHLFSLFSITDLTWDVFLIKSNTYKKQIKKLVKKKEKLRNLLHASLPQYIWVAQAYATITDANNSVPDGEILFDFIFDSVEMPYDGKPFLANVYSESFKSCLLQLGFQIKTQTKTLFDNTKECLENTLYKRLVENTPKIYEIIQKVSEANSSIEKALEKAVVDEAIEAIEAVDEPEAQSDLDETMDEIAELCKRLGISFEKNDEQKKQR